MRTFIAVNLDINIKTNISELIRELNGGNKSIRWVKPQGMHLTLKFIGEVTEKKVSQIKDVLDQSMKDYPPFELNLRGTGSFPPKAKFPRVLWVGVEPNETLRKIQARLENEMGKLQFPREKREFHPHLTLGRIKNPKNLDSVLSLLQDKEKEDFGKMIVNKVTFFQSTLKPTGAEYSVLSEHKLG